MKLADLLSQRTVVGELWRAENGKVRCIACHHRCLIEEGSTGICKVRYVREGKLWVPFGYVIGGVACDPVEKKPFYHLYPGSNAVTFGMLGCNFHCEFCQNWVTSQALRENISTTRIIEIMPEEIATLAKRYKAKLVVSSYNEPVITAEWAKAVFEKAVRLGLKCAFVSNGYATRDTLTYLQPFMVGYKVDLKTFREENYRRCGGKLANVLDTIKTAYELGYWVEIVTLVVPKFNDDELQLREIAKFIASLSKDIPWHVTAFHPDYKYTDVGPTPLKTLLRAAEIGREEGLNYVYAGNLPGRVGEWENTKCPKCGELLVERVGFSVLRYNITFEGKCPKCGYTVPGLWYTQEDFAAGYSPKTNAYRDPMSLI